MITKEQLSAIWRNPKVEIITEDREEVFFRVFTCAGTQDAIFKKIPPSKIVARWMRVEEGFTREELIAETLRTLGINKLDMHFSKY